jgi:hypothetical protein
MQNAAPAVRKRHQTATSNDVVTLKVADQRRESATSSAMLASICVIVFI